MTDMTLLSFDKPSKMASPTPAPGDCYGDGAACPRASRIGTREGRRRRGRALHRLRSVRLDAAFVADVASRWPRCAVVPNQRCGCWYAPGGGGYEVVSDAPTYFKSTDGHPGTWNFSLKRLNLPFLRALAGAGEGAVLLVDASRSKVLPDSLSRTVPIWCAVWNETVLRCAARAGRKLEGQGWGAGPSPLLFLPPSAVWEGERSEIASRIGRLADELWGSGLVDEGWLLRTVVRPLRPYWIANGGGAAPGLLGGTDGPDPHRYLCVLCVSCSDPSEEHRSALPWYTPGAADDDEAWARGLTPALFWGGAGPGAVLGDGTRPVSATDADRAIDRIVAGARARDRDRDRDRDRAGTGTVGDGDDDATADPLLPLAAAPAPLAYSWVGRSGLAVGTRRSGRPPECWGGSPSSSFPHRGFDAVLNVTTSEYDGMASGRAIPTGRTYLCCPVREGKRDRTELERWMAVAAAYVGCHLAGGRTVLVHCAQGMDRSVAVVMAAVALFCNYGGREGSAAGLPLRSCCAPMSLGGLERHMGLEREGGEMYRRSGMRKALVDALMGRAGRGAIVAYARFLRGEEGEGEGRPLADKKSLRLVLHGVRSHHERAAPTRSTLQKLNRFFMSGRYEETEAGSVGGGGGSGGKRGRDA